MRKNQRKRKGHCCGRQQIATALFCGLLISCGSASEFSGSSRTTKGSDAVPSPTPTPTPSADANVVPPTVEKLQSLTWYWQCAASNTELPKSPGPTSPVIIGDGAHQLPGVSLPDQIPLTFNGKLCAPAAQPRDIVFVVDVSGSMKANDPLVTGTNSCGRLDALDGMLNKYADGKNDIAFAVVTFDDAVRYHSTQFYKTKGELYQDMGAPSSVLCGAQMGTQYDTGLIQAESLLQQGRERATKEIYLISDGEPEPDHTGVATATTLKDPGVKVGASTIKVTIATIMLNGDDTVMEKQIASHDQSDKPLHVLVKNADQLTATLAALASTYITRAEIRYRTVGASDWQTLDVMKNLQSGVDLLFQAPPVMIATQSALKGIEVEFEYWNNNNQSVKAAGQLTWQL